MSRHDHCSGRWLTPFQYWKSFLELVLIGLLILIEEKFMKIIYWKASALILSWVLLGIALNLINISVTHLDRIQFATICIASAAYLIATTAILKPITHK